MLAVISWDPLSALCCSLVALCLVPSSSADTKCFVMAVLRNISATLFGAVVANMLPFLFLQVGMSSVSAKWAWMTSPPKCASAAPDTWDFDGQATIAAGTAGTVTCKNGGTPSVSPVNCPMSNENATQSSEDAAWWGICGFGDSCAAEMPIGTSVTGCTAPTTSQNAADVGSSVRSAVLSAASAAVGMAVLQ